MKYTLMDFILSDDYQQKVKDYLSTGLSKGYIKQIGDNYFDFKSLSIPVNLDCLNCEKVCDINCCGGAPYPPQQESLEFIKERCYDIFYNNPIGSDNEKSRLCDLLIERNFTVNFGNRRWQPGAIKKTKGMETFPKVPENGCVFNVKDGDHHLCAIHAYCLNCNIDPIKKKPIYCSLYPLCMIDLDETHKFIFCILDKDITFGMWQGIDFSIRPCFNKGLLTDPNRPYFKDEDYKPALQASINSVSYVIGADKAQEALSQLQTYLNS